VSHRIHIVLPDPAAERLRELTKAAHEPAATIARRLLTDALANASEHGQPRQPKPTSAHPAPPAERPPWLEPYGGDPAWRREMWGAIVALHDRYTRQLKDLKTGWWTVEAHLETLCALVVWRAAIDNSATDPREELAFHDQLADYAHTLRKEGGGVDREWKPGPPPEEWSRA